MQYLPLFFDIHNKTCLIVGGGAIAFRKASMLARAGARLVVVATEILPELEGLVLDHQGDCHLREFEQGDLQGKTLVIAATNNRTVNKAVSDLANAINLPVNVVDDPELCSFVLGSIVDRSPLMIAISSSGSSPVLARILRSRIETMIPAAYGRLATFVGNLRARIKTVIPDEKDRRRFWESVLEGPIAEHVLTGKDKEASALLEDFLEKRTVQRGEVCLVGAGPGDPDLLTFKALRLLQSADVVLYDRLVSQAIVDLARRDADKIYVGKARSNHSVPQGDINLLLIRYAEEGKRVVRLKGGDPFIFGRGGEEIEGLMERNIPFQVVPGITAASGCACYAGIPLTHRDYSQSVRFVTGHLKDDSCELNWKEFIEPNQTIVFYMGLNGLSHICKSLIDHGRSPETPVALVSKGTTPDQKVLVGSLLSISAIVEREDIHAPTLIIIGDVVKLHDRLKWFDSDVIL